MIPIRPETLSTAPRPWLTRRPGECAFPVRGEGVDVQSCCNPCGQSRYCLAHAAILRRTPRRTAGEFERAVLAFLGLRP